MTMKIKVENEDNGSGYVAEVITFSVAPGTTPIATLSAITDLNPGDGKEFWLHSGQYVTIREK